MRSTALSLARIVIVSAEPFGHARRLSSNNDPMNGGAAMDDRFDRRELLLHLGDMLEALSCLARTGRPDAPVAQLAMQQEPLLEFEFLRSLAPRMTTAEFGARVASAFFLWPKGRFAIDVFNFFIVRRVKIKSAKL
jgi:hypothetical protein